MKHYEAGNCILLHGAWHGAWVWKKVVNLLNQSSKFSNVLAPDLPGHGDNKIDFKKINLDTYVSYILDLIKIMPEPITLVGHSMAGIVISKIAEAIPAKIKGLIYLSGFITDDGGSLVDEERKSHHPTVTKAIIIAQENYRIKLDLSKAAELFYNNCNENDVIYALNKLQDQPLLPFINPVKLTNEKFGSVEKFYIKCLKDAAIHPKDQERMYSKINCQVFELNTDHSPFFSAPDELVKRLEYCLNYC